MRDHARLHRGGPRRLQVPPRVTAPPRPARPQAPCLKCRPGGANRRELGADPVASGAAVLLSGSCRSAAVVLSADKTTSSCLQCSSGSSQNICYFYFTCRPETLRFLASNTLEDMSANIYAIKDQLEDYDGQTN